jgi:hypothetical protein
MSEIDLNEIFLKNDDDKIDLDSPNNTTDDRNQAEVEPEPVLELKPEPKRRGRKKGTISEEQRTKMLENLKKAREKKKRELAKRKQVKVEEENKTLSELKQLREEVALLKSNSTKVKTEPVKVEPVKVEPVKVEPVKVEPVKVEPVKVEPVKVEKEEVVQLVKIQEAPKPKHIYHGFNPNKRRY